MRQRTSPAAYFAEPSGLREAVQAKYGEAARTARKGATASCGCGCSSTAKDPITSDLYDGKFMSAFVRARKPRG